MKWEKIIISVFILIVLTSLSLAKEKLTVDDPFQDENVTDQEIINETLPIEEIIPEEEIITEEEVIEEELIPEFNITGYEIDDSNFNETGMIKFRVDYNYSNLNIN